MSNVKLVETYMDRKVRIRKHEKEGGPTPQGRRLSVLLSKFEEKKDTEEKKKKSDVA